MESYQVVWQLVGKLKQTMQTTQTTIKFRAG